MLKIRNLLVNADLITLLVDIKVSVNYNIDEKGTADKRLCLGFMM